MNTTKAYLRQATDGVLIQIHAAPNAKKTEIVGLHGDALKVRIHAPPVDGAANEELCRFFAQLLGVKQSAVSVAKGETSKSKTLSVTGLAFESAQNLIAAKF